ncbi:hypothetical protein TNCT_221941 [Trichonephila clavata]|uniref:Uncharacterized protein n=1 Tax=Trichonephila clavata TaxID=2740835 RepID=A0A8X6FN36_TRICU|nr:hypothetical protein TNCT_221941 [Trichonephila clavata]
MVYNSIIGLSIRSAPAIRNRNRIPVNVGNEMLTLRGTQRLTNTNDEFIDGLLSLLDDGLRAELVQNCDSSEAAGCC